MPWSGKWRSYKRRFKLGSCCAMKQHAQRRQFLSLSRFPPWGGASCPRGGGTGDLPHFLLLVACAVGVVAAFFLVNADFPGTTLGWHQPLPFWIGIALMLCGLAFRWYSIKVLGMFFTRDVATRPGQTVVETGPYRWIRHPSYSGALLMFLGTGLAMTNWASLLAVMLGVALGYGYRVRVEERALCADPGQPYRDYMQRTRRFIPHVW